MERCARLQELLRARVRLGAFLGTHSPTELLQETLDEAERLTGSEIGFLHFVDPDLKTLWLQVWSTNTTRNMCAAKGAGMHYPLEEAGVWVDCIREGRPVIHNDYAGLPHRRGMPPGHAPVVRELVVPVRREGAIVAVLGVGNKPGAYTEIDVETVSQLGDMAWDLYVRRRFELDLRESERRLATLMANLPGMAYRCRNDRAWTMEFVSGGCLELTGYPAEEIRDSVVISYGDVIHPEDREAVWGAVQRAVDERRPFQMVYRIIHRTGETRWVWEQGAGVFRDGALEALEGFITDITDRRRAEEERLRLERQMQQAQKMESLGIMASGIAHDFNNILTAVLGHADIALADLPESSPHRRSIVQIAAAAHRAAELCRQMLVYGGKTPFTARRVDLRELIEEMAELLRATIPRSTVFALDVDGGLPPLLADPAQIRQVVMNLIINAAEAIGERGGVIAILARPTSAPPDAGPGVAAAGPRHCIELTITDSGCGMDEGTLGRIFEPFFTTKFAGRGLGLAAVLGIVRAHGGTLDVRSEPGKGTTFKIHLPCSEPGAGPGDDDGPARHPAAAQADAAWRGGGTVLFADDEEALREVGKTMLERLGYNVLTAADGREALELYRARASEIDLVFMDLTMPEMDGGDAATRIREIDPAARILLASGCSSQDLEVRFADLKLSGIVEKPYNLERLRGALARVMSGPAPGGGAG